MALIKAGKTGAIAALVFFLLEGVPPALHAQTSGATLLTDETVRLEQQTGNPALPPAELRDGLARLGKLHLLLGNTEDAANAFNRAAFADPENRDDRSLLEAARCYLALGETEKAEAGIQTVLVSGRDPANVDEARFLGGLSYTLKTGDTRALISLLKTAASGDTPRPSASEYGGHSRASAILYALWKITGNESYRDRLRAEHPLSQEARSLDEDPLRQIAGASVALWFLFPGRDAVSLETPSIPAPASGVPDPDPAAKADAPVVLQIGLFGREENALAMADRLKNAGFTPDVSPRAINGAAYFAVTVNAPGDVNAMILRLKDRGFESFPVY
jgi:tetratricopeptide (TPR) repeat protein